MMANLKSAILSVIGPKFLSEARITSNAPIGEDFRLIEFESRSLLNVAWVPGAKVQINTGSWVLRTYTPISIDPEQGRMKVLAFLPGRGPAAGWAKTTQAGDATHFKGPDGELKIADSQAPLVIFGDETAIGLAIGVREKFKAKRSVKLVLEVTSTEGAQKALRQIGIEDADLFEKGEGSTVDAELLKRLATLSKTATTQFLLAGRAQSIQAVRTYLKQAQVPHSAAITKVYWSEGRAGLD